jgi:hypothetical protein
MQLQINDECEYDFLNISVSNIFFRELEKEEIDCLSECGVTKEEIDFAVNYGFRVVGNIHENQELVK